MIHSKFFWLENSSQFKSNFGEKLAYGSNSGQINLTNFKKFLKKFFFPYRSHLKNSRIFQICCFPDEIGKNGSVTALGPIFRLFKAKVNP